MKVNFYAKDLNFNTFFKTSNSNHKETLNFKDFLLQKIKEVDESEKIALKAIESLAKGEEIDLSEVVLKISKADINFKLLLRIRNKILEAYQEIMRMQI